jgi:hypothetical protein
MMCVTLQWTGTLTTTMIESGAGWMSVQTVATSVPPNVSYLTPLSKIVNQGQLPMRAAGLAETAFFASNNVSLSYLPFLIADTTGFNVGNAFTGAVAIDYIDALLLVAN